MGSAGDAVADPVVGRLQRRLAQVLLVGRLQHVVGNVAGARHDEVAVVHRLGDDDRHQAVCVGDLFGVARLQRRQRRQELALFVHKAEHVGDIAERQLLVEASWCAASLSALGRRQVSCLGFAVVVEMLQLSLTQLAIERQPLLAQFGRQRVELGIDRLAQPGNVHLAEHVRLLVERDEFVGEAAVLQAVVQVDFAGFEALSDLAVQPELVAVGVYSQSASRPRRTSADRGAGAWAGWLPGIRRAGAATGAAVCANTLLHPGERREPRVVRCAHWRSRAPRRADADDAGCARRAHRQPASAGPACSPASRSGAGRRFAMLPWA